MGRYCGKTGWRARPRIIRPLLVALAVGAYGAFLLDQALRPALPELAAGRSSIEIAATYTVLVPGLVLAAIACRNVHTLFARPYLFVTPLGLALRQWKESESSVSRALGQLFLPLRLAEHSAVAWSEFRGCRVESVFGSFFGVVIIETGWGEVKVGRLFRESAVRLAREILAWHHKFIAPGDSAEHLDVAAHLRGPYPSRLAAWSLVSGLASFLCLPIICAIPAILLGRRALKAIRVSGGTLGAKVMAWMGLTLGSLNLALNLALLVVVVVHQLSKVFAR
jgi:hypothetical protein